MDGKTEFFSQYGVQWTKFACLQYFDLVKYTIIDPMHNLLLGVAKAQWYNRWIEGGTLRGNTAKFYRELQFIHDFLEWFEAMKWARKLPLYVGEPAGGSLTADECKLAVTGPWAVVASEITIPIVWERFFKEADREHNNALQRYDKKQTEYRMKMKAWEKDNTKSDPLTAPLEPVSRMQAGEQMTFLCFANALKIFFSMGAMKPNHCWAVHTPEQIRDYGPVYEFWAFLTKCLNKVLKNMNSNNWSGGRLEVFMMHEFHRSTRFLPGTETLYQGRG
ncbi:hypothetical protein DFH08DRAFT_983984 [Mycena albidolilacea]|uniref:Uncharacterized protein n=1 Tax=Mycena albidolilacea TaxID=1033008 RepID=A0AAD7F7V9_9AGAR|nr:hypothetical protein DFH08DRAFT_983984 [Mycena albidolilacea]